jgi:hypothetical protein
LRQLGVIDVTKADDPTQCGDLRWRTPGDDKEGVRPLVADRGNDLNQEIGSSFAAPTPVIAEEGGCRGQAEISSGFSLVARAEVRVSRHRKHP